MVQQDASGAICPVCYGKGTLRVTPDTAEKCETCQGIGFIRETDEEVTVTHIKATPRPMTDIMRDLNEPVGRHVLSGDPLKKGAVNHPAHYGGEDNPYEVIKVLEHWLTREEFIGALKFNIHKYTARARHKDGLEAHEKSVWYQNYLVDFLKRTV